MALQATVPISENIEAIAKYDPDFRFRQLTGITLKLAFFMTQVLSIFHIYTAGFGVFQEWRHRAFHLAFVLPLVFFLYTIRKDNTDDRRHLVHDVFYGIIGAAMVGTMFREILELSGYATLMLSAASFLFIIYFKRREFLTNRTFIYVDFIIFSIMIVVLACGARLGFQYMHLGEAFENSGISLFFWSVFLFGVFFSMILLFAVQWVRALFAMVKGGQFTYKQDDIPYFDVFFAILASFISVYIFLEFNSLVIRAGIPLKMDVVVGVFAFLLVLEGARRSIGPPLPIIAFIVLVNCYLGPYFLDIPGLSFFAHRGYSVERIIEHMYLGTEGIYGIPLGVVATFVFHFVLFGIFISRTGLGQFFMDCAMAIAGWSAGGPAKVAVISSGFMGSISGSSIANTVTTGAFTIPLMRRVGYSPQFAGAVEAASSTGGQLMPPIMGAAAFIMAEFLGIPYIKIAACAVVPAILYFFAVGTMVHLEAKKQGLLGLPREALPNLWKVVKDGWLLLTPLVVIVYLLISGSSPFLAAFWGIFFSVATGQIHRKTYPLLITIFLAIPAVLGRANPLEQLSLFSIVWFGLLATGFVYAFKKTDRTSWLISLLPASVLVVLLAWGLEPSLCAFWAMATVIAIGVCYGESRMRIPDIMETLELGTKNALAIGAACACIGFIVGATTLTGLGLKFAAAVLELAHVITSIVMNLDILHLLSANSVALFFTLVLTAVACFILGMGIPTTAQYIIASMIAAPALLQWGIHPLVSHMFVLFYAVLADVTPPVALAAYAASGISGANPFRTGLTAFGLASAGFVIPFILVAAPIILWLPPLLDPEASFDYLRFAHIFITLLMGVVALGAAIIGYLRTTSTLFERALTGVAAISLLSPEGYSDLAGIAIMAFVYIAQGKRIMIKEKKEKQNGQ
ncbi:MAG: TRAP transporter permease [Deltaproteobacteria bacterium]|nr:TRAP transporter permease [Deltaproteobacteria bacterium]